MENKQQVREDADSIGEDSSRARSGTNASSASEDDTIRMLKEQYEKYGAEFQSAVYETLRAIGNEVYPEMIPQGSSGSYFALNMNKERIAVFKPKNEEPYGQLNPKWLKWFHKIFFPCCFGRSCLVPNQGYLSEAGASIVDTRLGLGIVPKTAVVALAAPTFNYNRMDRALSRTKAQIRTRVPEVGRHFRRVGLPPKKGSFQLFVRGYESADHWLREWASKPLPDQTQVDLQQQFERMVILDYIIRNTDRGGDNWMIKYEVPIKSIPAKAKSTPSAPIVKEEQLIELSDRDSDKPTTSAAAESLQGEPSSGDIDRESREATGNSPKNAENASDEGDWEEVETPLVKLAAIDNGLAFPFKHPDSWRSYPYGWAYLAMAHQPFSDETVAKVLPLLENTKFVLKIGNELREVFKKDPGFDKKTFGKQLSVMYGQIYNLIDALRNRKTPAQLVTMPSIYMVEIKKKKRKQRGVDKIQEATGTTNLRFIDDNISDLTSQNNNRAGTSGTGRADSTLDDTTSVSQTQLSPMPEIGSQHAWHTIFKQKIQTRMPFFSMW